MTDSPIPPKYIDVTTASRMLDGIDRERIYELINAGEISAWRLPGRRTKYRIDKASVEACRERMKVQTPGNAAR